MATFSNIVIGGPPCQSFSNARSGGYSAGYRSCSGLIEINNFMKFVDLIQPDLFIMENAPTLVEQPSMSHILSAILASVPKGYNIGVYLINAEDYGVPQQRKRTFFLGSREPRRWRPPVCSSWKDKYYGWTDYLGLDTDGLLIRRGNALKGKQPNEAAYTVTSADLMCIRYSNPTRMVGTLTTTERMGQDQRPLTVSELAKLQGFPPDYVWPKAEGDARLQIGNAWNVNVATALAEEARRVLDAIYRIQR